MQNNTPRPNDDENLSADSANKHNDLHTNHLLITVLFSILAILLLMVIFLVLFWWPFNVVKKSYSTKVTPSINLVPIKIAAIGDIACDPNSPKANGLDPVECQDKRVKVIVDNINPEKILLLGDIAYDNGSSQSFVNGFDKTWGGIKTKMLPSPGNHEYVTKNAAGYYTYFGAQAGENSNGYYKTTIGNWSIYSLNSNCPETNDCSEQSTQINWLKSQLQKDSNSCKLAFWHHPQFSTAKHSIDPNQTNRMPVAWQLLQDANASIILNGHEHDYERFAQQLLDGTRSKSGIREFVVGTGGRSLYQQVKQNANSEFFYSGFGVLKLELYPGSYSWSFYNIEGKILDNGNGSCKIV